MFYRGSVILNLLGTVVNNYFYMLDFPNIWLLGCNLIGIEYNVNTTLRQDKIILHLYLYFLTNLP